MMDDIGPRKASPGPRLRLPRTLAQLMTLVALCGLAFAAARPRPEARPFPLARAVPLPAAVPIQVAGLDDRFVHPAPRGLDDRFIVAAREGLDDGIIVDPGRMSGRLGATAARGPRVSPTPAPGMRVIPLPAPMWPQNPYLVPPPGVPFRRPGPPSR